MTLKKKRKYGDLASQTANNDSDPDLIADVYAAFTGRRPKLVAADNETAAANQSAPAQLSEADSTVVQPLPQTAADIQSAPVILSGAAKQTGTTNLSKLLPIGPIHDKWTPTPNDITDVIQPLIKPQDYAVLTRLYRLARGFQTNIVKVSNPRLAAACNVSERELRRILGRLAQYGLIKRINTDFSNTVQAERGMVMQINLPQAVIKHKDRLAGAVNPSGAVNLPAPDGLTANKEHTVKETHTNTVGVGVSSRFSLTECRKYAESLRSEGIANPGGYATKIHRTGEADELIAKFLNPPAASKPFDASQCPDCHGTGWWYPMGTDKGAAKCKHQQLIDRLQVADAQ